jgi:murein DD-endopeptidase MepM/ murein hydrolase activator NlpD
MKPTRVLALAIISLAACDRLSDGSKIDTTTQSVDAGRIDSARAFDSMPRTVGPTPGVPAVPADSGVVDTGTVRIQPANPRRGGVVFAYAEGVPTQIPRCAWKGAPLPCYAHGNGVLAIVPLSPDEPAGTFTLAIDRAGGRITRQITVADAPFERELVFLDSARHALVRRTQDIARDARAVRAILAAETPDRLWSGEWSTPVAARSGSGYGADRLYYRASDSARAVSVRVDSGPRGLFGVDTAGAPTGAPGWRHTGVDLPSRAGTAVNAPAAGLVADAGDYTLTGRTVILDHGQGIHSAYFHLDTILVRKGDMVRRRGLIGRSGATGLATGPHLHYGVYVHGKDVDPDAWRRDMPQFVRAVSADSAGSGRRR